MGWLEGISPRRFKQRCAGEALSLTARNEGLGELPEIEGRGEAEGSVQVMTGRQLCGSPTSRSVAESSGVDFAT